MNLNDYKNTRKQLLDNEQKIRLLDKKINIINKNRADLRKETALYLSTPIYINLTLITISCIEIVPIIIPIINLIASIMLGKLIEVSIYYTNKYKQKLENFSTSKNLRQLLEEQTKYQVEKEQLLAENQVLENMCTYIVKNNFHFENNSFLQLNMDIKDKEKISTLCKKRVLVSNFKNYFGKLDSLKTTIKTGTIATINNVMIILLIFIALGTPLYFIESFILPSLIVGYYITRSNFNEDQIKGNVFSSYNKNLKLDIELLTSKYKAYANTLDNSLQLNLKNCYDNLISKNTSLELDMIKDNSQKRDYSYKYKGSANVVSNQNISNSKVKRKELKP